MAFRRRSPRSSVVLGLAVVLAAAQPSAPLIAQQDDASDASVLQRRVEAAHATGHFWAHGQRLTAVRALPAFYRARSFAPAWTRDGRPTPALAELLTALDGLRSDGLEPADYHRDALAALASPGALADADARADLDLLATDAFLVAGSHLLHGRVDPVHVSAEWLADRRSSDMSAVLTGALDHGGVGAAFDELRPRQPRYARMRSALAQLRAIEAKGGWPTVDDGPTLRAGDDDPRVVQLRRRLQASGDLAPGAPTSSFDDGVAGAVTRFQQRHGLDADGAVGQATREALNVPVEQRIQRLVVNLERWRWMPDDLGRRHIMVNIPDYSVVVREEGEAVLRMRGIVGREYRQTPVFTGRMTYLVLSPFWHVPPGIAANDKFPAIRNDPAYVAQQRMTLLDVRTNEPVQASAVDWSAMTAGDFNRRYRLRQDPGPANALGDVKFMFPNPHNVYLHDTPSRELFARTDRAFSSGCIRIERPLELAEYLLREAPGWDRERIRRAVEARKETTVTLPAALPVHLQYWTAFIDDEGRLNYRRDLYQRDAAVLAALRSPAPRV